MSSLSLGQTKSCGWKSMYIAKTHTCLIRFLDFTNGGSFLKVTIWKKYSVSSFLWSDQVCGFTFAFRRQEGIRGGIPLFLPFRVYYIHDVFLQHISLSFYFYLSLSPFVFYIDHVIKASDLPQQGQYSTKGNSRTSAYCNCANCLLIHETLSTFSK